MRREWVAGRQVGSRDIHLATFSVQMSKDGGLEGDGAVEVVEMVMDSKE